MGNLDDLIVILEPLLRLMIYGTLIFVIFFFLVRPFFNYLIINKDIELKKRLAAEARELQEAKKR